MNKKSEHSKEMIPNWISFFVMGLIFLLGFIGLLFSTVMVYAPFNLDLFLGCTDIEFGFICFFVCILFAPFCKICLYTKPEHQEHSMLGLFFIDCCYSSVALFPLTLLVISPVEYHYSDKMNGGTDTIFNWLIYAFIISLVLTLLSSLRIEEDK